MSHRAPSILAVGLSDPLRTILLGASRRALPAAVISFAPTLDEAFACPEMPEELLVLSNPAPAELERVLGASDAEGLPRWTPVAFASRSEGMELETILPETADETLVAQALRSALARHRLRRELAKARGDLRTIASRVSHDLRASLGGIVTTGEALKEVLEESAYPGAALMGPIFESADRLARLIERVSFVARASANQVALTRINMGDVWWAVQQRVEWPMLKARASLVTPDSWPVVNGVASWLETVWWNLLTNSLQHGGSGLRIEVGCEQDAAGHRFWLRDNGGGIAVERRRQLFQPLHTLHNISSKRGLGLSIVHRLMELQDGQCGYEPLPAGGSCFWFNLPTAKVEA